MRNSLLLLIVLTITTAANAQTTIRGKVTDAHGEAIPGANIFILDSYDGTSSDVNGDFSFSTSEIGKRILVVKFVGYKEYTTPVELNDTPLSLKIEIHEQINELEAVTINAGSFTAGEQGRRTVFKAIDIATTAGATADIAGALNTLPGTQKVGESGRLFVRGGDGSETRTFIDGMVVLDAYNVSAPNAPSRGRFLPFMFKGTSFSTGGYSAEFGQALSSALALDSKDEDETTRTDIGILSVGGDVAHTQAWDSGSAAAKIQYTNIRPYFGLINQEVDWKTPPASLEAIGAIRQKIGKSGMLKLYGNFSGSDFSLYQHDIDDQQKTTYFRLKNNYRYTNASYKTSLNNSWALRSGLSYSAISNNNVQGNTEIDETEKGLHVKSVVEGSLSPAVEIKSGVELLFRDYSQIFVQELNDFNFTEWLPAVFAEADMYASNRFVTRLGARAEYNSLSEKTSVDPRISVAYKFANDGQLSFAYGTFRQTASNKYLKWDAGLKSEKAQHYILNYQLIRNNRTFRLEGFYKSYDDLVKFGDMTTLTNDGSGYAKGIELFWRDNHTFKGLDYWVSYSLLDTRRNYLNFPEESVPYFASRHNFSLVAKYFVRAWKSQIGATYSYASGRPYNNPNQETFNDSETPAYQDLSLNWSYLPKPYLIIYFSCTNLPGYDNIFGYEFSNTRGNDGVYNGRPIRQPAPRFLFVGIFITLSKNKSFNQLPSL
jgi:hypothetical protein